MFVGCDLSPKDDQQDDPNEPNFSTPLEFIQFAITNLLKPQESSDEQETEALWLMLVLGFSKIIVFYF